MENLRSLMSALDGISNVIPEGTYLDMADNLKKIHDIIPKPNQLGNILVNYSDSDTEEEWHPGLYDEWVDNESVIQRMEADLKYIELKLRSLKYICNITKKVKENAIKDFCDNDRDCVGGGEWTFENLNANTIWSSEEERKECTTKKYERNLYLEYRNKYNRDVERLRHHAMELKADLENDILDLKNRQTFLRTNYNL